MPTYTVVAVSDNVRDWSSTKGGPMKGYRVTLRNADGREMENVEWSRKATTPAPEAGLKVEGTVDTSGPYGAKFKQAQQGGGFGGGGRGPRDPAERRSIEMQASQKVAVDAARLAIETGVLKVENLQDISFAVRTFAGDFFKQVEEVAK